MTGCTAHSWTCYHILLLWARLKGLEGYHLHALDPTRQRMFVDLDRGNAYSTTFVISNHCLSEAVSICAHSSTG